MKIIIFFCILFFSKSVYALDNVSESMNTSNYLNSFKEVIQEQSGLDINPYEMYESLITGESVGTDGIVDKVIDIITSQIRITLKSVVTLFLIVLLTMVLSSIELDKNSDVVKISKIIIAGATAIILLKNYIQIQAMLKDTIGTISYLLQLSSTFLTGVLVATGKITSTGTIAPLIMFISSAIVSVTNFVIIPLFSLSIAVNIVSQMGDSLKLDKLSNMFRKSSMYIYTTGISVFVFVLSLENTISKSIDNIYFKATQNIVSDSVPVVGKFLADSLDTVMGATELVGKVGGTVAIICTILIVLVPIGKVAIVTIMYKLLSALCEIIGQNEEIGKLIDYFSNIYKDIIGIIIGTMVLFVSVIGIIMLTISKIT